MPFVFGPPDKRVKLDEFAPPDDSEKLNVSTKAHGLAPKLSGDASTFLNGAGRYTSAGGGAPAAHATTHQNGGSDEINVGGLSGQLADPQTPLAHKTSHENGGADEISVAGLSGVLADPQTPIAQALLDGSRHSDTVAQAPTRGSLIVANASNLWDEKTIGAAGTVFSSDGTDAAWALPSIVGDTNSITITPAAFTVTGCVTNGTTTLTTTSTFLPIGGPAVVTGMLITGTNIPAGTYVKHLASGTSLTMTAAATGSGSALSMSFQMSLVIAAVSDETGKDVNLLARGAVRFTPGTEGIPFRIVGDFDSISSGAAASGKIYLEAGSISGGSAVGGDLQIGGPSRGELVHANVFTRTLWLARGPLSGTDINVGVAINPAEYNATLGPGVAMMVFRQSGHAQAGLAVIAGSNSTAAAFAVLPNTGTVAGTSPNRTLSVANYIFKVTEDSRVWVGSGAGAGFFFSAPSGNLVVTAGATTLNMLSVVPGVASWSDSAVSTAVYLGDNSGTSDRRAWFSSAGNAVLSRLGFSSKYNLITNSQAGQADFEAPAATPQLLHLVNSSTADGANAAVVLEIETRRTGQTADIATVTSAVAGSSTFRIDNKARLEATLLSTSRVVNALTPTLLEGIATSENVICDSVSGDVLTMDGNLVLA